MFAPKRLELIAKQLDATADALDNQRGRTSNYPKSAWRAAVAAGRLVVEAVEAGGFDEAARQLVAGIQHPREDARYNTVFLQMCQSWMKPRNSHIDAHGGSYSYPNAMRLLAGELVKPKRKRRWTPDESEPFMRAWLMRMEKDNRPASLRNAEADLSISKSTIARTTAWKELGSDKRKHVAVHTDLAADKATLSDCPDDPLGTA